MTTLEEMEAKGKLLDAKRNDLEARIAALETKVDTLEYNLKEILEILKTNGKTKRPFLMGSGLTNSLITNVFAMNSRSSVILSKLRFRVIFVSKIN